MTAYTDTELQEIAIWLRDGLSAARIAVRFTALRGSPVSRNAIIGIVHRNAALKTIGFANPGGGRSGGRPRKDAARQDAARKGAARKGTERKIAANETLAVKKLPALPGKPASQAGLSKPAEAVKPATETDRQPSARSLSPAKPLPSGRPLSSAKPLSPARPARSLSGEGRLVVDGEVYRFNMPAPRPAAIGRQPHVAAMRFIDCLFNRCRAPLDLTLEENPEKDAPGSGPGPGMLCCGLRTRALKSYCAYHQARFHRPVAEVV